MCQCHHKPVHESVSTIDSSTRMEPTHMLVCILESITCVHIVSITLQVTKKMHTANLQEARREHPARVPVVPFLQSTHTVKLQLEWSKVVISPCICEQMHPWTPAFLVSSAISAAAVAAVQQQLPLHQLAQSVAWAKTQTVCDQQATLHSGPTSRPVEVHRTAAAVAAVVADTAAAAVAGSGAAAVGGTPAG